MREVEFLPEWYPKVRKRRRMVALQAWITFILFFGLGLWTLMAQRNVYANQHALGALQSDLYRSEEEIQHLEEAQKLETLLGAKDSIRLKIGTPIKTSKMMAILGQLMPADMALLELTLDTELAPAASGTLASRAVAEQGAQESKTHLRIHGVSPTDVDLAEFLAKLTSKPFFRQVELLYSHERVENGHVMREFEVSLVLDLSPAGTSSPQQSGGH